MVVRSSVAPYRKLPPLLPHVTGFLEFLFYSNVNGSDHVLFMEDIHAEVSPKGIEQF